MKIKAMFTRQYRTREEKRAHRIELSFGALSGVLLGLSYPPLKLPFFAFFSLVPYLFIIEKREGLGSINRFTYFSMFFFNLITLYWVGSWTAEADPFLKISGVALVFFNPATFLIPSTLYSLTKKHFSAKFAIYLLPLFWTFYEYIYGITEFRFPWLTFGNTQANFLTFIQIADIIGTFGLSGLLVLINVLIYKGFAQFVEKRGVRIFPLLSAAVIFLIVIVYGFTRDSAEYTSGKKIKVGLIQPNLNPWNKWEIGGLNEQLQMYLDMSAEAVKKGAEIVIYPETALPVYLMSGTYPIRVKRIQNFVNSNNVPILTGMPDATIFRDGDKIPNEAKKTKSGYRYVSYNSILLFSPGSNEVQKYKKMLLVPFGEKTPYVEYFPAVENLIKWNVGISAWNVGTEIKNLTTLISKDTVTIGGVICIESIYPWFVSEFVDKGAEFIAVVTNDSWYGDSSGPYQHKEMSVLRAVENRRTVVRCANGGISCVIYPDGKTIADTKMFTKDILVEDVILNSQKTFYTKHPLIIPWLSIFAVAGVVLLVILNKYFKMNLKIGDTKDENN